MRSARVTIPFLIGFFLYALIEIAARGYTHWTMALTGGAVFAALCHMFRNAPPAMPLPLLYLCGAVIITTAELSVGVAVNLYLHWNVWDYSDVPMNFHGQICPLYSSFWYLLCIPARYLWQMVDRQLDAG